MGECIQVTKMSNSICLKPNDSLSPVSFLPSSSVKTISLLTVWQWSIFRSPSVEVRVIDNSNQTRLF